MLTPLESMNAASFASGASLPFRVVSPGEPPVKLRLVDVHEDNSDDRTQKFSLMFTGPRERPLSQGIKQFDHDTLGTFAMFVVPVGADGPTVLYQAVFNRLTGR